MSRPRELQRTAPIYPLGLEVGMEIWRHPSPHMLRARVRGAQRRGEVALMQKVSGPNRYGQYVLVVKRLQQPRRRWVWVTGAIGAGMATVAGALLLAWQARYVILGAAAFAAWVGLLLAVAKWGANLALGGHQCAGLHCPGCRG